MALFIAAPSSRALCPLPAAATVHGISSVPRPRQFPGLRQEAATLERRVLTRSAAAPSAPTSDAPAATSVPWWERPAPENVKHITSVQEMVDQLAASREQLVVAEFFAPWCGACRALYPKLCKMAADSPDVLYLCINFDESRALCKGLNVKVLPYFHLYRGPEGRVAAFSASVSKIKVLKDAIAMHNTPRCALGGTTVLEEFPDVIPGSGAPTQSGDSSTFSGIIAAAASLDSGCGLCDGPSNGGIAAAGAQQPPILVGPFDGDALMA